MALAYNETLRNNRLAQIGLLVDAGTGPGLLSIYGGVRPASGGAATTLLAQMTMGDPSFQAPSGGTVTANAIVDDDAANETGTATWWRLTDSDGNFVIDGDAGVEGSGSDLELPTVSIVQNVRVGISTFVITEANA